MQAQENISMYASMQEGKCKHKNNSSFVNGTCTMIVAFISKLYLNFLLQSEKLESGKTNIKK